MFHTKVVDILLRTMYAVLPCDLQQQATATDTSHQSSEAADDHNDPSSPSSSEAPTAHDYVELLRISYEHIQKLESELLQLKTNSAALMEKISSFELLSINHEKDVETTKDIVQESNNEQTAHLQSLITTQADDHYTQILEHLLLQERSLQESQEFQKAHLSELKTILSSDIIEKFHKMEDGATRMEAMMTESNGRIHLNHMQLQELTEAQKQILAKQEALVEMTRRLFDSVTGMGRFITDEQRKLHEATMEQLRNLNATNKEQADINRKLFFHLKNNGVILQEVKTELGEGQLALQAMDQRMTQNHNVVVETMNRDAERFANVIGDLGELFNLLQRTNETRLADRETVRGDISCGSSTAIADEFEEMDVLSRVITDPEDAASAIVVDETDDEYENKTNAFLHQPADTEETDSVPDQVPFKKRRHAMNSDSDTSSKAKRPRKEREGSPPSSESTPPSLKPNESDDISSVSSESECESSASDESMFKQVKVSRSRVTVSSRGYGSTSQVRTRQMQSPKVRARPNSRYTLRTSVRSINYAD